MGVDYYECNKCGCGFRDDSDYCIYCSCGSHFCDESCADPVYNETERKQGYYLEPESCCVCRNEHCTDYGLLQFLLGHFNISRGDAEKLYFEANPKVPKKQE